jgi:hypothetical protein
MTAGMHVNRSSVSIDISEWPADLPMSVILPCITLRIIPLTRSPGDLPGIAIDRD